MAGAGLMSEGLDTSEEPVPRRLSGLAAERAGEGVGKEKYSVEKDLVVEQADGGRLLGFTQKRKEEGQKR